MINIDISPEQAEFEQFCWLHSIRHLAHTVSKYEAMEVFKEDLPAICLDKIANNEQALEFKGLLNQLRQPKDKLDIQRAKQYPIMRLAEELTCSQVRFHKIQRPGERTASIHIYESTNTFWDFGLNKGGDPIDLLQLWTGLSFKKAVKRLL